MNIHEYQAKQLLARYGVAVPFEIAAKTLAEVRPAADKIAASGSARVVVKSQIHAGGRGKGTFQTGFQGGVKVAEITTDTATGPRVYDPTHPDADANGYVTYPNVDIVVEMTNMLSATRSYEANLASVEAVKRMALKALEIGR